VPRLQDACLHAIGIADADIALSTASHTFIEGTSMKLRATLATPLLFLAIVFPPSTASAESITVQTGSMIVDGRFFQTGSLDDLPTLDIQGTHGFAVIGTPDIVSASGPWQCRPCDLNNRVEVTNFQGGSDLTGVVDFEGKRYTQSIATGPDLADVFLRFLGDDLFAPPVRSSTQSAVLSGPFELRGSLVLPDVEGEPQPEIPLFGRGRATIVLMANRGGAPVWEFKSASYVFGTVAPVPEPGTIFLVGGAIIGLARRQTRRSQRVDDHPESPSSVRVQ
jgi:hypothetical protein